MRCKTRIITLSVPFVLTTALASSSSAAVSNANHLFNAIHSSMRQWGGSLNHNGMSLFLATVPEGTQLYHGTSKADFIEGMQWLAFEPEHALIFAGPRGRPPGKGERPPPPDERHSSVEGVLAEEGWNECGPLPGYRSRDGHGYAARRPHRDEHGEELRNDKDHEHHHTYGPLSDREHEPQRHREHGLPPPLPPGHIYKPYPPPPRRNRPVKGPKHPWDAEQHQQHPSDLKDEHRGPLPDHNRPLPPPHNDRNRDVPHETLELRSSPRSQKRRTQQPLFSTTQEEHTGYLHTYAPTHDLHLLYIDGLSAGKTSNGTLDTQDLLLLNMTSGKPEGGPMGGEMARAGGLCALASSLWEGKVDGFIRLEGGFEIILCEFEKHLHRVDIIHVSRNEHDGGRGGIMGGWSYLQAITSRYHGIGGGRVHVDYDNFVSVFQYDNERTTGLWDNDVKSDVPMPRLTNVSHSTLAALRTDVTQLILAKDWAAHGRTRNWQDTADMLVARYSAPLQHLTSTAQYRSDKSALAAYLSSLLRPFIDTTARNASLETTRCVAQFIPSLPSSAVAVAVVAPPASLLPPLAHRALHAVATRLCDALLTSLSIASATTPHSDFDAVYAAHGVEVVDDLVEWLGWTSWKECRGCKHDEELCFIPIWPMGSAEDHATPRCRREDEVVGRSGYWGRMGPGRRE